MHWSIGWCVRRAPPPNTPYRWQKTRRKPQCECDSSAGQQLFCSLSIELRDLEQAQYVAIDSVILDVHLACFFCWRAEKPRLKRVQLRVADFYFDGVVFFVYHTVKCNLTTRAIPYTYPASVTTAVELERGALWRDQHTIFVIIITLLARNIKTVW